MSAISMSFHFRGNENAKLVARDFPHPQNCDPVIVVPVASNFNGHKTFHDSLEMSIHGHRLPSLCVSNVRHLVGQTVGVTLRLLMQYQLLFDLQIVTRHHAFRTGTKTKTGNISIPNPTIYRRNGHNDLQSRNYGR